MASNACSLYLLEDVTEGMQLGTAIVKEDGKILLAEGTLLTNKIIERLRNWGVTKVGIREDDVKPDFSAFNKPFTEEERLFRGEYTRAVGTMKLTFDAVRKFKKIPGREMNRMVDQTLVPLVSTVGAVNYLHQDKPIDDYTFFHSVNTAIIAGVVAQWLGYQAEEIREIVAAGLLHDVGKTQIPLEILNKPGKLNHEEMKVMQLHATYSYKLISESGDFSSNVALAALQHHERLDGTGYPAKVLSRKIHPYAKLVALADIYDAMTSDRVYREKVTPFEVVETLIQDMFGKLDPDMCSVFLKNLKDHFIGYVVQLNDGREAEVVFLGQSKATRPVVRTRDGNVIGLDKTHDLGIVKVLRT